eukprot:g16855.t1
MFLPCALLAASAKKANKKQKSEQKSKASSSVRVDPVPSQLLNKRDGPPHLDEIVRDQAVTENMMHDFLRDKGSWKKCREGCRTRKDYAQHVLSAWEKPWRSATAPNGSARITRRQFEDQMRKAGLLSSTPADAAPAAASSDAGHAIADDDEVAGEQGRSAGAETGENKSAALLGSALGGLAGSAPFDPKSFEETLWNDFVRKIRSGDLEIAKDGAIRYDLDASALGGGWLAPFLGASTYELVLMLLNIFGLVALVYLRRSQRRADARRVVEKQRVGKVETDLDDFVEKPAGAADKNEKEKSSAGAIGEKVKKVSERKGHNAGVAVKKTESVIAESLGLGALSRELRRSHREPDRELTRFETRVKKIVEAPGFDALVGFVLLANATAIAVEQQHTSRNTHAALFSVLDILFLAFFTVELALRYVHVGGSLKYFSNWMWFDVTVVAVGFVTDVILPHFVFRDASKGGSEEDSSSAINDSMNALKALRCMRLVRMFSMVEHLWTLALTFLFSAKPLFWTVVFLMIVLFVFAVFLAALCVEEHPPSSTVPAQTAAPPTTSCATFTGSFLALLRIMTFDDWIRTILELTTQTQKPALMVCFFGIFVATASLALMNLVTAVVFDSASRRAAEEQAVKQNHFEYQLVAHKAHVDELQALLEQHHVYTKARKRQLFNILRKGSCCASLERALDHLGLTTEEEVVGVLLPLLDPEQTGCIERNLLLKAMLVLEQVGYNAQAAALVQSAAGVEGKRFIVKQLSPGDHVTLLEVSSHYVTHVLSGKTRAFPSTGVSSLQMGTM